jgi:hypothetical protein
VFIDEPIVINIETVDCSLQDSNIFRLPKYKFNFWIVNDCCTKIALKSTHMGSSSLAAEWFVIHVM